MTDGITFAMLRAFVTMGETLNLAITAEHLGLTRQTVRRHINDLETIKGARLFVLDRQSYTLTDFGHASLHGARALLRQRDQWCRETPNFGEISHYLEGSKFTDTDGRVFASQQHPVSAIPQLGTSLMAEVLSAWGASTAAIDAEPFDAVRRHLVVYRRHPAGWICVSVGEDSAYAQWFGSTWARSAVGRLLDEDNAGDEFNAFIGEVYQKIYSEGGVRLDHLFAHLPRESADGPVPVAFQRVLLGCAFPDGTPALAVLIRITPDVVIPFLPAKALSQIPPEVTEEFRQFG